MREARRRARASARVRRSSFDAAVYKECSTQLRRGGGGGGAASAAAAPSAAAAAAAAAAEQRSNEQGRADSDVEREDRAAMLPQEHHREFLPDTFLPLAGLA